MAEPRTVTASELRALAHPLSWRILRLCLDHPWTNQQLAERIGVSTASVHRQVRALANAGFLNNEPARQGQRGAWERPYRATGRTWHLELDQEGEPVLSARVELAAVAAHLAEMREASDRATFRTRRGLLTLGAESQQEFNVRLDALIDEFASRVEPDAEPSSFLWSLTTPAGEGSRESSPDE